jgi:hypothetical protein
MQRKAHAFDVVLNGIRKSFIVLLANESFRKPSDLIEV